MTCILPIRKPMKIVATLFLIFVFAIFFFFLSSNTKTSAHVDATKHVCSVVIQDGDTLWSIANTYHTELDGSIDDYVSEIKETNDITSDVIHEGNYLLIPYYVIP